MAIDETEILVSDLEDVRQVLAACLTYFSARDLGAAQIEFRSTRPSPITLEIERVRGRFDSYLADHLLRQHEESLLEEAEEAQDGSEEDTEASEEVLADAPLGKFKPPTQSGRRLSVEEVVGDDDAEPDAD